MPDYDGLAGVGAFGNGFMQTYLATRKIQRDDKNAELNRALQAKIGGLQQNAEGTGWDYTPEKQKSIDFENQAYDPTSARTRAGMGTRSALLNSVGLDPSGFISNGSSLKDINDSDDIIKSAATIRAGFLNEKEKSKREKSQKLAPASDLKDIGSANAAVSQLDDLMSTIDENKSIVGPGTGLISRGKAYVGVGKEGESKRVIDSQMNTAAQEIGRYLEGGKLSDNDVVRYKREILPNDLDTPDVYRSKAVNLKRRIIQKQREEAQAIQQGGYSIGSARLSEPVNRVKTRIGSGQPDAEDAVAIQWAQNNRGDPRAIKILQMHGAR